MRGSTPEGAAFCETECNCVVRTKVVSRAPRARIEGHGDPCRMHGERPDPAQCGGAMRFRVSYAEDIFS